MTQEEIRMSEPARARSTGSVGAHISASAPGHGARGLQRVRECLGVLASGGQSSDRLDGLCHQVDAAKWRAGEEKGSVPATGGLNGRVAVLRGVRVIALITATIQIPASKAGERYLAFGLGYRRRLRVTMVRRFR